MNEAAQNMDEATIFTIHGFCQRMLKRHAFESGALFESELTDQSDKFLSEAVYDFWRKWFYRQPREIAEAIYACWKEPDSLKQTLIPLLSPPSITFDSPVDETTSLKAGFEVYKALLEDVKRQWLALGADEIYTLIQSSGINKSSYSKRHLPGWLAKVTDFCESQSTQLPKDLARFDQETLMSKTKKGEYPKHPLFSAISALLAAQVPVKDIIIQAAYHEVKSRLASKKTTLNVLAFDDLLNNLHSALHGDAGLALAKAIRDQFPVAMIDEFQDTDLVQYEIFTAIWRHSTCSINTAADESYLDIENTVEQASVPPALVMIGDPKQAIYAFRGADIFTYIRARREISHHYTLDKNWRSTPKMIAGVNHLFAQHPAPFIYQNDIAFLSVKAGKTAAKHLTLNGRSEPALQLWFDGSEEPISKAQYLT
ncbi:MAG: UvrD-helicase domain-containing protein, partial [Pontibacterium sp.]